MTQQKLTISVPIIAQETISTPIILTLQNISVFMGILVSISALGAMLIKIVSNQNKISSCIEQIEITLKEYALNAQKIRDIERTLDLHVRDYTNQNKIIQIIFDQLDEKVDEKIRVLTIDTKEMQGFLKRQMKFSIQNNQTPDSTEKEP